MDCDQVFQTNFFLICDQYFQCSQELQNVTPYLANDTLICHMQNRIFASEGEDVMLIRFYGKGKILASPTLYFITWIKYMNQWYALNWRGYRKYFLKIISYCLII